MTPGYCPGRHPVSDGVRRTDTKQLAPASHVWETEHLDAAAAALGVNRQVVRHQVENREGLGVLGLAG
jgi:hypothetical protein